MKGVDFWFKHHVVWRESDISEQCTAQCVASFCWFIAWFTLTLKREAICSSDIMGCLQTTSCYTQEDSALDGYEILWHHD
jgi:hypothetical protein